MFFMDVQWNTIFHHVINKQSSKAAAASVKEEGVTEKKHHYESYQSINHQSHRGNDEFF